VGECRFFYAWREPSWRTAPARPRIGGRTAEGQRNVLDSRALYAHAHAADALYRTSLRHELEVRTPWSAWRSFEGVERVVGLDEGTGPCGPDTIATAARNWRGRAKRQCGRGRTTSLAMNPSVSCLSLVVNAAS